MLPKIASLHLYGNRMWSLGLDLISLWLPWFLITGAIPRIMRYKTCQQTSKILIGTPPPGKKKRKSKSHFSLWSGARMTVGAQEPFQERSRNHSIFWSNFESILDPLWLPKWLPKALQKDTTSTKSQPKHEKDEFLKMSTSLTRDTNFRNSRVPKTPPKSRNNATEVPQKAHRFLHRFLDCIFYDLGSILGPP